MHWIAIAVGAFYVFAGVVVLRAMALDRLMDVMLRALGEPVEAKERRQSQLLGLGACLTFASGLTLVTLSRWSTLLFAANSLVQGSYLVWASKVLPPETADERQGRSRTINAFVVYLAAFAFVAHAHGQGVFMPWPVDIGALSGLVEPLVIGGVTAGAWAFWFRRSRGNAAPESSFENPSVPETDDMPEPPLPKRLRLAAEHGCWPIWDDETGDNVDPADLDLSEALLRRLEAWDSAWQATFDEADPRSSGFAAEAAVQCWKAEGQAIAAQLAEEWQGPLVVKL
ncbi:MAG: hypothetical protein KJZ80_12400 [Hyphomicrobiaceae bacterium]|nr:hypothetical protein [Hyphomicrobiaceae bacterium]